MKGQPFSNNNSGHVKNQLFVPKSKQWTSHTISAEVMSANSQRNDTQQASLTCIFCKGNHFNGMCDKFPSLSEGRWSLSQQGRRHFVYLKISHMQKDCPSSQKKYCCYCGKRGH